MNKSCGVRSLKKYELNIVDAFVVLFITLLQIKVIFVFFRIEKNSFHQVKPN